MLSADLPVTRRAPARSVEQLVHRCPAFRRRLVNQRLVAGQLFMIAHQDVPTLLTGEESDEFLIGFGKEPAHVVKEPVNLGARAKKDAAKHQPGHTFGMRDGIGKGERASP